MVEMSSTTSIASWLLFIISFFTTTTTIKDIGPMSSLNVRYKNYSSVGTKIFV